MPQSHLAATLHLHRDQKVASQEFNDCGGFVVVEIDGLKIFVMKGTTDVAIRLGSAILAAAIRLEGRANAEG